MPKQDMSDTEIADLVAFLDWVSKVDNQGWPPRPILVTGAGIATTGQLPAGQVAAVVQSAAPPGSAAAAADKDPVALGATVFKTATPACSACHALLPGVNLAGPSLAGVATRARQALDGAAYKGQAKDVDGFLREPISQPSAHLVAGAMYSAGGVSFMPDTYGKDLSAEQVGHLAAYLASFK